MKDSTALLVVDIQDSFKHDPARWAKRNNPAFERNVSKLLQIWRESGQPVIFIQHTDPDPGFRPTDPEFRLMDFLGRGDDEPLLVKSTRNAFSTTDLEMRLDALGVRRIAVCGLTTEQCCETTTRVANDVFGYEVDFISDATATFPIGDLAADEIVRRTEAVLRGRFARILSTADVEEEALTFAR